MEWVVGQIDLLQDPQAVLNDLKQGKGDAAQRVFTRSFDLPIVGEDGRAVLLALALFSGGATRPALIDVAGLLPQPTRWTKMKEFLGRAPRNPREVGKARLDEALKHLSALWLVETTGDRSRLTIGGLTRELTKARLSQTSHADELRRRFVAYYLHYVKAHAQPIATDFDVLEAEKDNLLGAMEVAFELAAWESVMALVDGVSFDGVNGMLRVRGYWEDALRSGDRALTAARQAGQDASVTRFGHNLATMHQRPGELAEARRLYDESLEIEKRLGNQSGIASSLGQLGLLAEQEGNKPEAARLFREALTIFEKLKSPDAEIARESLARVEGK